MGRNVLVVSEDAEVRRDLARRLDRDGVHVTQAVDGTEAIAVARSVAIDVVLFACRGPAPGVRALRRRIRKERPEARFVPLTCFGSVRSSTELLRFGREDYLLGIDDLAAMLAAPSDGAAARPEVDAGVRALVETVDVLVGLLELEDRHFAGSAHRTSRLARAVAEDLGLDGWSVQEVAIAALLRDLGKISVDDRVLDSTGPFTLEQYERMQSHVDGGIRLLEHVDFPWKILPIIRHHHERYDGRGYPEGLRGREIPLESRILTVIDAYVALTSDRAHRPAVDPDEAIDALEKGAGTQFDPEVVEVLIRIVDQRPGMSGSEHGRVILVDPQDDSRELIRLRLTNEGFEVHAFDDLDAGLEALDDDAPDIALIDPGPAAADVVALLRRTRDDTRFDLLPLVVLARFDDPAVRLRALRQGVDEWFAKSGDLEELGARVENLLVRERRRSDRAGGRRRGVSGDLANLSLPEIVQTLVIGNKTACVRIAHGRRKGRLWFADGALVHARQGRQAGQVAFWEMLRWPEGEFVIEHGVRTRVLSIEDDAMYLVMEGLRLQDEERPADGTAGA